MHGVSIGGDVDDLQLAGKWKCHFMLRQLLEDCVYNCAKLTFSLIAD